MLKSKLTMSIYLLLLAGACQPDAPVSRQDYVATPTDEAAALLTAQQLLGQPRTVDGNGNNAANPTWGTTDQELLRLTSAAYGDGSSTPAGTNRPSARAVSNTVHAQSASLTNNMGATDMLWQWGQIVDHDIDLTEAADPNEPLPIAVPIGDPFFDPFFTGTQTIPLSRSRYASCNGVPCVRQQTNQITAYLDASFVYGSDAVRAAEIRLNDGTGMLNTSAGNLLPFNVNGLPNAQTPGDPARFFLAGDVRANEQAALTAMHTLFVREHNRLALRLREVHPGRSGDEIYQMARAIVGAEVQAITYNEFLPVLLGTNALPAYTGYNPNVNAGIANEFSTASYRFGHTLLSSTLRRLNADGSTSSLGDLQLRDAFFTPERIINEGGIEPLLRGLVTQKSQELDVFVIDDVRNFLFGPPGSGGFDLASLNIQRGRDHGLASYNLTRAGLGLAPAQSFADISSNKAVQARLAAAYSSVNDVDLWTGALAEDHVAGGFVGELLLFTLGDQFRRLRDGDRFFYANTLSPELIAYVESIKLADVIRMNTPIDAEIADDAFLLCLDGTFAANIDPSGLAIPDNNTTGLSSAIEVGGKGRVGSLRVKLDITHTWRGDLYIVLISPAGGRHILQNRTGSSQDDLHIDTVVTAMDGEIATGTWTLRVMDLAGQDTGTLDAWSVTIVGDCATGAPTCDGVVCSTGAAKDATCNSCISDVCFADPYCCDVAWDSYCVSEVFDFCTSEFQCN